MPFVSRVEVKTTLQSYKLGDDLTLFKGKKTPKPKRSKELKNKGDEYKEVYKKLPQSKVLKTDSSVRNVSKKDDTY